MYSQIRTRQNELISKVDPKTPILLDFWLRQYLLVKTYVF